MAIKVIVRKEPPEKKPFRVTCFNCKSILEFLESDAERYSDIRDGTSWSITCPICSKSIYAYERDRKQEVKDSYVSWRD